MASIRRSDWLVAQSHIFATHPIAYLLEQLKAAARSGDDRATRNATDALRRELYLGSAGQWRAAGMAKPGTLNELKQAMVAAGFGAEYIVALEWTPASVAPTVLAKLASSASVKSSRWSKALSIAELARLIGRSEKTVKRYLAAGKIRHKVLGTKTYLVDLDDLPTTKR